MSEQQQYDSPLVGERGSTNISDTVVATIAGRAAQEVEGAHMGGSASRAASGILGNITGSESQTRGVSVEVGQVEAAIDLTMGVEYGRNILQIVDEVRRRISDRVQSMTGLQVTELNVTISDIIFPEKGGPRRRALGDGARTETRPLPGAEEHETTEESPDRTRAEEEVRVEGEPVAEDETAELKPEEDETRSSEER
ncbi:MAG: Asp23/Gls24 family envelope stress response protein [Actinobacteria bacterium]|nr:Asp23/Gls24 family envelope stress response protein [Actinomycetota bacterium]